MTQRLAKSALMLAVALIYALIVFNNLTDYNSNYQFVRHVLMMDSTFPGNHGMWREVDRPAIHTAFYVSLILWETVTTILCALAAFRMLTSARTNPPAFERARSLAIAALTLGCLQWFVAFLSVGAEWFLMWQSRIWNGQDAAFRMFASLMLILLFVSRPEPPEHVASHLATKEPA